MAWNSNILIQENALENVVCEMPFILSRSQCVNILSPDVALIEPMHHIKLITFTSYISINSLKQSATYICQ